MVGFTKDKKYKILPSGTRIRFLKSSKYDYDFKKGDKGRIERILSPFPKATDTIYQIKCEKDGESVWVVGTDVEPHDQLSLEDIPSSSQKEEVRNWRLCNETVLHGQVSCILPKNHVGPHGAEGIEWNNQHDWRQVKKQAEYDGWPFYGV